MAGLVAQMGGLDVKDNKEREEKQHVFGDDACAICQSYSGDTDRHALRPCGHVFHIGCVSRWWTLTQGERKCPTCRSVVSDTSLFRRRGALDLQSLLGIDMVNSLESAIEADKAPDEYMSIHKAKAEQARIRASFPGKVFTPKAHEARVGFMQRVDKQIARAERKIAEWKRNKESFKYLIPAGMAYLALESEINRVQGLATSGVLGEEDYNSAHSSRSASRERKRQRRFSLASTVVDRRRRRSFDDLGEF